MPRVRSVLLSLSVTVAGRAHQCRFNETHRIVKGDRRLTIKADGEEHHYCLACGRKMIGLGLERLHDFEAAIAEPLSVQGEQSTVA
jgi:hypothetical protein